MSSQQTRLTIAAGPRNSESYQLSEAIADVFNADHSKIHIEVFETSGSAVNIRLLQEGRVDFATAQADSLVNENTMAVAALFEDAYQLIVNGSSGIQSFNDLIGKRVVIAPKTSGQHDAFWSVAKHYGVEPNQLTALPMSEAAGNFALQMGQVDAVYRVRAPGNQVIRDLVRDRAVRLVKLDHAEALSLRNAALSPGVIPAGTYRGSPAVPKEDLPTALLQRVLVARADLDSDVVHAITALLFEHYSELAARSHLAGFISPITADSNIPIPVHPGARRYYDREKPGFLQRNTRILASFLYVGAILTSIGVALRSRLLRARKVRIGDHTARLMHIAEQARNSLSVSHLNELKNELVSILQKVVADLSNERVSQEEFEHFSFTWQAVNTLLSDQLALATSGEVVT